jgi:hypothetical protein
VQFFRRPDGRGVRHGRVVVLGACQPRSAVDGVAPNVGAANQPQWCATAGPRCS